MISMLKKVILVIVSIVLVVQPIRAGASDRDESWKLTVKIVKEQLPKLHKNFFFKVTKNQWNKSCDDLMESLPNLKDNQIRAEIMRIVASVGDSHTSSYYFGNFEVFPYEFQWFKDGVFCEAATISEKEAFCKKLVAIEGEPVDKILDKLRKYISHDNESWFRQQALYWLTDCDLLESLGIIKNKFMTRFTFEDKQAKRVEVVSRIYKDYSDIPWEKDQKYQDNMRDHMPLYRWKRYHYWAVFNEDVSLLYVQYNRCREYSDFRFSEFLEELKKGYDELKPRLMIFDIRQNSGGSSSIALPMIQWIATLPVNDPSRLFVITGKQTYSSAVLNACHFKMYTKATFVGEPTGGRPNHYGEVRNFELSYAKMKVFYSTKYFRYLDNVDTDSLYPDDLIETTSDEYFDCHDPIVENTLAGKVKIPERKDPPKPILSREQKWKSDLDLLRRKLVSSSSELDLTVADIEKTINILASKVSEMTDTQMKLELQSLVSIARIPELKVELDLPTLPFMLVSLPDGIFVYKSSKNSSDFLGMRLTKIGKHNVDTAMMLKFRGLFPSDNFNGMAARFASYAIMPDILHFLGLVDDPKKVELEFEDREGCKHLVTASEELLETDNTLTSPPYDKPETAPFYMSKKNNYWSSFLKDTNTLYTRIAKSSQDNTLFEEYVKEFEDIYGSNYPARIVVDFRGNTGGSMKFADEFIRRIVIKANAMRLPVFVLVDRYTGGSAVSWACILRNLCKAKIVGENTGTWPNHSGNPELVTFDNEMVSLWIPTESYNFDQVSEAFALCPDIHVNFCANHWLKGADPVLEAVVNRK